MSDIRPVRIVIAGIAVIVAGIAVVFLVVTGYAFKLAFEVRGQPDQEAIQLFASRVAPWLGPLLTTVFLLIAAFWIAARAKATKMLNGLLVGVVVGAVELTMSLVSGFGASDLFGVVLPVAAAWLGGTLAERRSRAPFALSDT